MNPKMLELLYKSFDATLTPNEQEELERALIDSEQLRSEKEKITKMRESISGTAENSFNPFFADRVMQRITAQKEESEELFVVPKLNYICLSGMLHLVTKEIPRYFWFDSYLFLLLEYKLDQ